MKKKYILFPSLAIALAITACKEKTTTAPAADQSGVDKAEQPTIAKESKTAGLKPAATTETRAARLGFAKHLPKNIISYDAVFNGREAFDKLSKTSLGGFILERMADEGISLDDLQGNDSIAATLSMYGEEYFTAYGPGMDEMFGLANSFLNRLAYYGSRVGVYMADGTVREGKGFNPKGPGEFLDGPLKGAPKELIKMIADFDMPAVYQGAKVSNEDSRSMVMAQMKQSVAIFAMLDGAAEEINIKRGGAEFHGYKLDGVKLAEKLDDKAVQELQEVFDIGDIKAFKKTLASKSLVAVTGQVGDYAIIFLGKSEDDFVLVDDLSKSLCASEHIVFINDYLDKDLLAVGLRDEKIIHAVGGAEAVVYRIVSAVAQGLSDGLSIAGSLGDTQDIEAILESLSEQGLKLAAMFKGSDAGYVFYLEDGLKAEAFGGSNLPAIDFNTRHTLAPMGAGEGTLLFANWTSNQAYNEKVMEYVDTLGETGYLVAKRIAGLDIEGADFKQLGQGLSMFDQMMRDDILEIWKALRGDMAEGLGGETALAIDVNGSLPKIPNVPDIALKEGKMPRIAYVSTVDDRKKLQKSWKRLNMSIENLLKKASEMSGTEIPMQLPMSSEKNELKTWFVPIPFQNDDFVPSVSVSDELFLASTSKNFSEGLAAHFKQGGGEVRKGAWLHVDFKVLRRYAQQWADMMNKHADELIVTESARADFKANKEMLEKALSAFSTLEKLTFHARLEGGHNRVSMHLKAK